MNKKLFLGMFAAATMLFATSCQNDELDAVQAGNEATVSFTLGVEGGVQTRATISDGSGAKQLHYRVFNEDGSPVSATLKKEVETVNSYPYEVKMTLAKGQKYKIAFFAKNAECDAYTVDENMQLTIDYEGNNNDEKRDAFFKTVTIDVTGNDKIPVVLKRPFAQINVGVTNEDWAAAIASDIDIQSSKVVIKNAATKMNLIDGSVTTPVEVTYDFGATPKSTNEVLKVDLDGDGAPTEYNYLSMSYILVNDGNGGAERANLDEVEFTFKPTNPAKNPIVFNTGLNGVPVQRNYRTNIIGQLLTGNITFDITIDHNYDGEIDIEEDGDQTVYNVNAGGKLYKTLADAINAGETDIVLGDGEHTLDKQNLNADLKITGTSPAAEVTWVAGGGNDMRWNSVTLENVTVVSPATGDMPQGGPISVNAPFILKNCVIENVYFCLSKKYEFNGCTFNIENSEVYNVWTYGADVNFENCVFNSAGKSVLIYSHSNNGWKTVDLKNCEFYASTPVDKKAAIEIDSEICPFKVNIEDCTATGFGKGSNSGNSLYNLKKGELGVNCNIKVVFDGVEYTNQTNLLPLSSAEELNTLMVENKVIILTQDIDFGGKSTEWNIMSNCVFDGNGHKISNVKTVNRGGSTSLFRGDNTGDEIVIRNLIIDGITTYDCSADGYSFASAVIWSDVQNNTNLTIDNVHIYNATIPTGSNVGGFIGFIAGPAQGVTIKNSSIHSSTINGESAKTAALVGRAYGLAPTFENVVVENVSVNGEAASTSNLVKGEHGYTGTVTVK